MCFVGVVKGSFRLIYRRFAAGNLGWVGGGGSSGYSDYSNTRLLALSVRSMFQVYLYKESVLRS